MIGLTSAFVACVLLGVAGVLILDANAASKRGDEVNWLYRNQLVNVIFAIMMILSTAVAGLSLFIRTLRTPLSPLWNQLRPYLIATGFLYLAWAAINFQAWLMGVFSITLLSALTPTIMIAPILLIGLLIRWLLTFRAASPKLQSVQSL
ncbi:MAG: hypothetical protein P1V20_10895 [Verrucomicrobiales bacterium]|nr:hypothetical protein [Verrucomicrobiales bacterium]